MPQLLAAALILGLGWYGLKFFARASPALVARSVRSGGGVLIGLIGLLLLVRGNPELGLAGIAFGLWLGGFFRLPSRTAWKAAARRATGRSQVRSRLIEMELDHATGQMSGTVIAGAEQGRPIDTLTRPEAVALYGECLRVDPEGARLLEAYLDRRFPGWGETGEAQRDSRGGGDRRDARSGMSPKEAYEMLGLRQGATRTEIVGAHRTLMKKAHPDYGGTTEHAARVNEAKEVLLRSVR